MCFIRPPERVVAINSVILPRLPPPPPPPCVSRIYSKNVNQTLIDVSDPAQPTVVIAANEYGTVGSIVVDHEVAYFTMPDSLVSYDLSGCVLCPADLTGDGVVNFFDVSAFLVAYTGGEPGGDWNGDGVINFFDVSGFLVDFNAGCP